MEIEKPEWLVQMEGILETLNEGVMILNDCEQIIFVNEYMAHLSGYSAPEVLGRTPSQYFQGDDLLFLRQQIERNRQQGENRYEFHIPHRNGTRIPVIVGSRAIEDLEGRVFGIITFTDISAQKRVEMQLREANAQLEERQREIDFELSLAERVQQSLAPPSLRWGRIVVETAYQPVRSIGGDFGMVVPNGNDSLTLMVCDVSGHGISSALIANRIYTEAISLLERNASLGDMLRRLNEFVLQHIRTTGFYFTMAAARLDRNGRRLTYAGAGHPPALHIGSGNCSPLMPRSALLGLLEDAVPDEAEDVIDLEVGDRLVLYTDGITESFNDREEQFGTDGLQKTLLEHGQASLPDLKNVILDRVAAWRNGPAADDASLVLLEIT